MKHCEDCIHDEVCGMWAVDSGIPFVNADTCVHYKASGDAVNHGEWVSKKSVGLDLYTPITIWSCSCCGWNFEDKSRKQKKPFFVFCPMCGKPMDGKGDEDA